MHHLTSAFQEAHVLINNKKWPVLQRRYKSKTAKASLIALHRHGAIQGRN